MGFEEFVELGPTFISRIEKSVFEELGWKEEGESGMMRVIDLEEFTKILQVVMDLSDVGAEERIEGR